MPGAAVPGAAMPKKRRCLPVRRCWTEAAAATTLQALCRRRWWVRGYLFALREAAAAAEATAVAAEAAVAEFEREEREA